jgi:hypothetical protein
VVESDSVRDGRSGTDGVGKRGGGMLGNILTLCVGDGGRDNGWLGLVCFGDVNTPKFCGCGARTLDDGSAVARDCYGF